MEFYMADKLDLELFIENGIDIENRKIFYGHTEFEDNEITWNSIEIVIRGLHYMYQKSNDPIEIHMSSCGGNPHEMLRLYDHIQSSPCQIKFYGSGLIASAAVWIMVGCDERHLMPNTKILVHDSAGGSIDAPGKLTDLHIYSEFESDLAKTCNRIFAENTRMPIEFWENVVKRDLWLDAHEAISLGLADKLVEPKKRGNYRKARIAALNKTPDSKDFKKLISSIGKRIHQDRSLKIELHIPVEEFEEETDTATSEP